MLNIYFHFATIFNLYLNYIWLPRLLFGSCLFYIWHKSFILIILVEFFFFFNWNSFSHIYSTIVVLMLLLEADDVCVCSGWRTCSRTYCVCVPLSLICCMQPQLLRRNVVIPARHGECWCGGLLSLHSFCLCECVRKHRVGGCMCDPRLH